MTTNVRTLLQSLGLILTMAVGGCGFIEIERTLFPNQAADPEGRPLFIEDLQEITADTSRSPEMTAEELRNLGIESEELIDAIVEDGLGARRAPKAPDAGG